MGLPWRKSRTPIDINTGNHWKVNHSINQLHHFVFFCHFSSSFVSPLSLLLESILRKIFLLFSLFHALRFGLKFRAVTFSSINHMVFKVKINVKELVRLNERGLDYKKMKKTQQISSKKNKRYCILYNIKKYNLSFACRQLAYFPSITIIISFALSWSFLLHLSINKH